MGRVQSSLGRDITVARMSRWFRAAAKAAAPTMIAEEEEQHLRSAENALLNLLDDDIQEADRILNQQDSTYHCLGRGISSFIASMLGVEKELLKDASEVLQTAENKAWEDMKRAQREPTAFRSKLYPPGTEYLLCFAVAQLTGAITAVLSGSVTEAVRGFYKLRKAYLTLDGIMEAESRYFREREAVQKGSRASWADLASRPTTRDMDVTPAASDRVSTSSSQDISREKLPSIETDNMPLENHDNELGNLVLAPVSPLPPTPVSVQSQLFDDDPASLGLTSHTDIFIHSGTRLCYGILLVVFSMIENPLFSKILYIVGFKGDRKRGTQYLWQASRFTNFNSVIAGIALLGYYNSLVAFCDILPTDSGAEDDLAGYPRARCQALLRDMRERYPESKLWKLEDARMEGHNKNLKAALQILIANSGSKMKQIATINMFETSLTAMFVHDYELCAECWIKCAELSKWSPTLYAYFSGASYLELYRTLRQSDPAAAELYKVKATEYFRKGPPLAGRQKVMSKHLPFDVYIVRKVKKWEERSCSWNVDLVDAIGVSPLAEMIYLWNGLKKSNEEQLQKTLDILQWNRTSEPERHEADLDERATQALLHAAVLRNMKKFDSARELLKTEILSHDR